MPTVLRLEDLPEQVGRSLGSSDWFVVRQEAIDGFAAVTEDFEWIHVDRNRARSGPFGTTIAHGFLTLALGPRLLGEVVTVTGAGMSVNYGLDRVRFPHPVPAGSSVRLSVQVRDVRRVDGAVDVVFGLTFEMAGAPKPVCVADHVIRYFDPSALDGVSTVAAHAGSGT